MEITTMNGNNSLENSNISTKNYESSDSKKMVSSNSPSPKVLRNSANELIVNTELNLEDEGQKAQYILTPSIVNKLLNNRKFEKRKYKAKLNKQKQVNKKIKPEYVLKTMKGIGEVQIYLNNNDILGNIYSKLNEITSQLDNLETKKDLFNMTSDQRNTEANSPDFQEIHEMKSFSEMNSNESQDTKKKFYETLLKIYYSLLEEGIEASLSNIFQGLRFNISMKELHFLFDISFFTCKESTKFLYSFYTSNINYSNFDFKEAFKINYLFDEENITNFIFNITLSLLKLR